MWVYNCNFTSLAPHPVTIMYHAFIWISFPTYFDYKTLQRTSTASILPTRIPAPMGISPFQVYPVTSKTNKAVTYIYMCVRVRVWNKLRVRVIYTLMN